MAPHRITTALFISNAFHLLNKMEMNGSLIQTAKSMTHRLRECTVIGGKNK